MKRILLQFTVLILFCSFVIPVEQKCTLWLIGDSTMSIKETRHYPETGWGMPFRYFWDSTVVVENRARNGKSTRTFMKDGLWQPVEAGMQEGDYLFIQFGHNDEVKTKGSYTTETEFVANLKLYIATARSKKAKPILLTPVARRKFDSTGKIIGTHDQYAQLVRQLAKEEGVPLIDLDLKGQELMQQMGVEGSKLLFNHLAPDEHPNYPGGKVDDTHFSELGARKVASIVLSEIRRLDPQLSQRTTKQPVKK